MKDTQSKVHIENIINYLMLAPLPFRGAAKRKLRIIPTLQKVVFKA